MNRELKILLGLVAVFLCLYFLPVDLPRFQGAVIEAFRLSRWYAREHVLLCLVPAFFIAGAIGVFVSQNAVMKYFGPKANKALAYGVASVSGTILAVCSCAVLPLFGGIYARGAGLGPAIAFLYSGPAINVLAITLTARVLGWQLGVARAVGAIAFSVVIGLLMHLLFIKEERAKAASSKTFHPGETNGPGRPLWQTALTFGAMIFLLVAASRSCCEHPAPGMPGFVAKWRLVAVAALTVAFCLWRFMAAKFLTLLAASSPAIALAIIFPLQPLAAYLAGVAGLVALMSVSGGEMREWRDQTWTFAKQITPQLFAGVMAAGFFLGSPDANDAGIVPNRWVQALVGDSPAVFWSYVGGNAAAPGWLALIWPVWTNFFASFTGALMYFATLTEVPILRGLMDSGMGQGPALALLLAGPALSLPSMLVINSILGPKKTLTFVGIVVAMATIAGMIFERLF